MDSLPHATAVSTAEAVEEVGLIAVTDDEPGIRRILRGSGFAYLRRDGKTVREAATLGRIRSLAIPPAWTNVWIAPRANGHLQATGRDDRGRKQYRYHPDFVQMRGESKFERLLDFADALPKIRRQIRRALARRQLDREKVVAAVVHLLDVTLIRVGNEDYARQNGSYGLTTLLDRHVALGANAVRFEFMGKSGKRWQLKLSDRRVTRVIRTCQEIPGQRLFQYIDETGERRAIGSADVNSWLREASGCDITAKDFRTWAGTVAAAVKFLELDPDGSAPMKAHVRATMEHVAAKLQNTPTICRKCYVHPEIVERYLDGSLPHLLGPLKPSSSAGRSGLRPEEAAVRAFLRRRIGEKKARRPRRRQPVAAAA